MTKKLRDQQDDICFPLLGTILDMCSDGIAVIQNGCILYSNSALNNASQSSRDSKLGDCVPQQLVPEQHSATQSTFTPARDREIIDVSSVVQNQQALHIISLGRNVQSNCTGLLESHNTSITPQSWATLAHKFNNLLTCIILYSDLLVSDLGPDRGLRHHAETVLTAALNAAQIIKQVTNQLGKKPAAVPLSWNDVASEMSGVLTALVGPNIAIKTELSEPVGPLSMDMTHAYRIILSLVLNAQDAMPQGGTITISTQDRLFTDTVIKRNRPIPQVELVVTDTGRGIYQDALMQSRYEDPKGSGSGKCLLGLSVIRGIVQRAGGELEIESNLGGGTSVTIRTPITNSHRKLAG